jgi:hypothetical protein
MRLRILLGLIGIALLAATGSANASMFGTQEDIHKLIDVNITGQQGEPLFLGYKTSTLYVLAGVYVKDDGYVFGLRDKSDNYINTSPEEIAKFQQEGLLPNPLPKYTIGIIDYLLGYSLWIVIVVLAIVYGAGWLRKRGRAGEPATPVPPAATPTT